MFRWVGEVTTTDPTTTVGDGIITGHMAVTDTILTGADHIILTDTR